MNKFRQFSVCILVASIALLASCGGGKPNYKANLKTDVDSASYYFGYYLGGALVQYDMEDANLNAFLKGVNEAVQQGKEIDQEKQQEWQMYLNDYLMKKQTRTSEKAMKEGQDWLEANKKKQGVVTLPSGVQYKIIKDGSVAKPTKEDMVDIVYHGTLIDGTIFQSSRDSGDTLTHNAGSFVPGFSEAITLMNEGSIWEVYIPSELGYGENTQYGSPIPPNSVLIFEINLVKIKEQE